MKILLMGPQGSGKGTIGDLLSEKLNLPAISVGKLLRSLSKNHPCHDAIDKAMDAGELAPYKETSDIIRERVSELDCADGYILDGWARNMEQLQFFDPDFDCVLYIDISPETSIKRITGRRVCERDGFTCNIYTLPSKHEGRCDVCGGELVQREDDTEEAARRRLEIFYLETVKVVDYYRSKGILLEIDGESTPEGVFRMALEALERKDDNVQIG